jgi:hypothetical protein
MDRPDASHGARVREGTPVDEELWSLKIVLAKICLSRSILYEDGYVGWKPSCIRGPTL